MLQLLIERLAASEPLTEIQISQAVAQLVDETVAVDVKADFLSSLSRKGATGAEITVFARELRARAIQPVISARLRACPILDVVGTGGDRLGTFNISTAAALLAAAAGVVVAKHGNRASTSSAGSADVLEALGVPWDQAPEQAVRSLETHGFAFFFAPRVPPRLSANWSGQETLCSARPGYYFQYSRAAAQSRLSVSHVGRGAPGRNSANPLARS